MSAGHSHTREELANQEFVMGQIDQSESLECSVIPPGQQKRSS